MDDELTTMRESARLWQATSKRLLAENQRLIEQNERLIDTNRRLREKVTSKAK